MWKARFQALPYLAVLFFALCQHPYIDIAAMHLALEPFATTPAPTGKDPPCSKRDCHPARYIPGSWPHPDRTPSQARPLLVEKGAQPTKTLRACMPDASELFGLRGTLCLLSLIATGDWPWPNKPRASTRPSTAKGSAITVAKWLQSSPCILASTTNPGAAA